MVKADAACITSPSDIEPSRNFGAHKMMGKTGAMKPDVCDTLVVFMFWKAMCRQAERTFDRARLSPARSSSSPRIKAMLSPFSRRRVIT